ncbi:precorrin-2 C(20)-methyltransferase [Desulfofundulus sp. TPOSR]|uniref:precorrin-2 C(20)-methyltransferase n=1 Tax=Desulfofundulus sp. TPOSR TaxID=2714340 RepID=UPI001A9BADDA
MRVAGKFYGIGVGPGDPELLTLKAYRVLQEVDVVCVPKSAADRESLALSIINRVIKRQFTTVELSFPMSRDRQILEEHWARAGERVAQLVREGQKVAFVTIGDPMFYSTYGYVRAYLQKNYPDLPVETIPGITAMSACAAALEEPLATGEESLAVIPAAYNLKRLEEVLDRFDNVVLMKVNRYFDRVLELLREKGLTERAALVSRCGHPDQMVSREVTDLAGQKLDYMSILVIHKGGR